MAAVATNRNLIYSASTNIRQWKEQIKILCYSHHQMATHEYHDKSSHDKAISSYFILTLTHLSQKLLFKDQSAYIILESHVASSFSSGVLKGVVWGRFKPPTPLKFQSLDKAEPNSQFRGKHIRNNLIRIQVSLICKLSGTPDQGASEPRSLCPLPSTEFAESPPHKIPGYATEL
jgi:hypothetical protein